MTFSEFYKYSWFANMAYILWNGSKTLNKDEMIRAANDENRVPGDPDSTILTLGQEIFVNQGWTVSSFQQNDAAGFAANLFVNENTNEKVLSIRGTEVDPSLDPLSIGDQTYLDLLAADITEIGTIGLALNQGVSLFNYVKRLQADAGSINVTQLKLHESQDQPPPAGTPFVSRQLAQGQGTYVTEYFWFETSDTGTGLGLLKEGDQVTVTGHSLGGHLAALALRLFPGLFDQAVTFNAPGFDPVTSSSLTDEFIGLFSNYLAEPPAETFSELSSRLYTLESEDSAPGDDRSIVSSLFTGTPASTETLIRTENDSHSMDQFMDALGVLSLIESLNPQLSHTEIFGLFDAVSPISGDTEERFVQSFSKLFLNNDAPLQTVQAGLVSHGDFALRGAIHERILEVQQAISGNSELILTPFLTSEPAAKFKVRALGFDLVDPADAIAYRYALVNLNPFVITGNNAFYEVNHNQNGELDLFDQILGSGTLTESYLEDRSAFLHAKIVMAIEDTMNKDVNPAENITYYDIDSSLTLHDLGLGGAGQLPGKLFTFGGTDDDSITGSTKDDHLYGGGGNDFVDGQAGNDYLEGNQGEDELVGGTGKDTLLGGKGNDVLWGGSIDGTDDNAVDTLQGGSDFDTYIAGFGDVVEDDLNGEGQILFRGELLRDGGHDESDPANVYHTADGEFKYVLDGTTLTVTLTDDTNEAHKLTVNNFTPGQLGIQLFEQPPPPPAEFTFTEIADVVGLDELGTTLEVFDEVGGNIIQTVTFSSPFQYLEGLGGNDVIQIDADIPNLVVYGDQRDGETGTDGNDFIDIDRLNVHDGVTPGDAAPGALLYGQGGDDFISGSQRNDIILGGTGHDFLRGNAGRDVIDGGSGAGLDADPYKRGNFC